jgi:hypothetical protein
VSSIHKAYKRCKLLQSPQNTKYKAGSALLQAARSLLANAQQQGTAPTITKGTVCLR